MAHFTGPYARNPRFPSSNRPVSSAASSSSPSTRPTTIFSGGQSRRHSRGSHLTSSASSSYTVSSEPFFQLPHQDFDLWQPPHLASTMGSTYNTLSGYVPRPTTAQGSESIFAEAVNSCLATGPFLSVAERQRLELTSSPNPVAWRYPRPTMEAGVHSYEWFWNFVRLPYLLCSMNKS
jgi:hypothetical protein